MHPVDALTLCARIANALAAAHRGGVIHRDLKPGNVMLTPDGRPMLVDFGIAKTASTAKSSDLTTTMTATTRVVGTPAYMSPEQIQQRPLDGRSDLFALGLILFECLTGRRAFEGSSPIETAAAIMHVELPSPSKVRSELTPAHDDLCRRLTAKNPDDRFQSADEVIGAIRLLLPDGSTGVSKSLERPSWRFSRMIWMIAAFVLVAAGATAWRWSVRTRLPVVPADAKVWSDRGIEAIREGAYETARKELEQSVALFPQHALGHARLAEAQMALDDSRAAQETLLRVAALVPDESRLPAAERLRVQAVRAMALRGIDGGISAYRQLVTLDDRDSGAWLDLGRAQEEAGLLGDARGSYQNAIDRDDQDAAAFLRLGTVNARQGRPKDVLSAFNKAEQLYQARSDIEGETQVLLARGSALDLAGELAAARGDLERALHLSLDSKTFYQQIQARLAVSSITASQGHYGEAQQQAAGAVTDALAHGLDVTAAGGLVDLAATLLQLGQGGQAEADAKRALDLAEQRGARMTAARAKTQLASIYQDAGKSDQALALIADVLPFFKASNARWSEVTALLIASRSHRQLDHLEQARQLSSEVMRIADTTKDDAQIALAATNLASVSADLGDYPAALALRVRAEEIHRRLGDEASLPFDLTNRAELLVHMGRLQDASQALDQLDAGIARGLDSYVARRRRALFVRALISTTKLDCADAVGRLREVSSGPRMGGSAGIWAPAIGDFCDARLHRPRAAQPSLENVEHAAAREAYYWRAAAALAARDSADALAEARAGLALLGSMPNDELRWRLAASETIALRELRDPAVAEAAAMAGRAVDQLRSTWGGEWVRYSSRPDLAQLGKNARVF
jgi:tetratricopeptide (TPR) repeat protein